MKNPVHVAILVFLVTVAEVSCISITNTRVSVPGVIEAEDYSGQEKGSVVVLSDRVDASGECIAYWYQADHAVDWKIVIPKDGEYKLVLRYTHDNTGNVYREVRIDGKSPGVTFARIAFPGSGGWARFINSWKNMTVLESSLEPALLKLSAGPHSLRIINRGGDESGSLYLDNIGFLAPDTDPGLLGRQAD